MIMNSLIEKLIGQVQVKLTFNWSCYDKLKELEIICPDESGKQIYRKGQVAWKTRALIVQDKLLGLKELYTVNEKELH